MSDEAQRIRIAQRLAQVAADYVLGAPLDDLGRALQLTESLPRDHIPTAFTFSGGVAEYIFTYEEHEFGDIAKPLARELTQQLGKRGGVPLIDPGQRIRATVIGASQFTVQVSGKTIYLQDKSVLPVHNIPVVHLGMDLAQDLAIDGLANGFLKAASLMDLDPQARLAVAFTWAGDPEYSRLLIMAKAIMKAFAPQGTRDEMLVLMIDGDVGRTLGRILDLELHLQAKLVSIDGMQLQELDYVDIGEYIDPPGVVPVVIKSLLFS
jgi:ethanolamine utilization protein EutA